MLPGGPDLLPVGDSALLVVFGKEIDAALNARVHALARALAERPLEGLGEAAPAYASLLVHYDPLRLSYEDAAARVADALARQSGGEVNAEAPARTVEIPVCYGGDRGPDLDSVARHASLSPEEVIRLHVSARYRVFMVGFSPGFPYLGTLPAQLATPRLATPRTQVPAGSVGIAGRQTGIYPVATPGGWQIIGQTPLRLFDPRRDAPALLHPGDAVRFTPIESSEFDALRRESWAEEPLSPAVEGAPAFEVLQSGPLTTVQDRGRRGWEHLGVPVCGAMDAFALLAANRLVGNAPGDAALEVTGGGLVLRALADTVVAACGADLGLRVHGWDMPPWTSALVRRGWLVELTGRRTGWRAVLAVAGGIAAPPVLGSRSTYVRGGFGGVEGRALRTGDLLAVGPVRGHLPDLAGRRLPQAILPLYSDAPTVDVILGPESDAFTEAALEAFLGSAYRVSAVSDRMGYRLQGPEVRHATAADILSEPLALGAVQVPADRQPILMMADRPTAGGYAKIATVATADMPLLAQCVPGEAQVRFRATTVGAAQRRLRDQMAALETV